MKKFLMIVGLCCLLLVGLAEVFLPKLGSSALERALQQALKTDEVTEILDVYQHCDPYLNRRDMLVSPLLLPCSQVWQRFGNSDIEELTSFATQLKEYFRSK